MLIYFDHELVAARVQVGNSSTVAAEPLTVWALLLQQLLLLQPWIVTLIDRGCNY